MTIVVAVVVCLFVLIVGIGCFVCRDFMKLCVRLEAVADQEPIITAGWAVYREVCAVPLSQSKHDHF